MELKILEASKALGLVDKEPPKRIFQDDVERIHKIIQEVAGPDIKAQENALGILIRAFEEDDRNGNTSSDFSV